MRPISPPSFAVVRADILDQHARLRLLLDRLDAKAEGVVRSDRSGASEMSGMLEGLLDELAAHMAFEEEALAGGPGAAGVWEAADLVLLTEEHQRQRAELARIEREALHPDDPLSLALAIRAFIADVRLDMSMEEDRLQRRSVTDLR